MAEITTDWTKEEFKAYLLSYVANANFFESEEEEEIIHSLVSDDTYKKIHKELAKDNDYQSIQKIYHNLEKFNYSKDEMHVLMDDIKEMFAADGEIDDIEQTFLVALKRIFR
jgi:hypothetical protein